MAGSSTRERASSWPESHHYRPFDKPDKTHKECLSLVSLSSKGRAFPPSLLPASVGILMFLSPSPSLPASLSLSLSHRHTRDQSVLSPPCSFSFSLSLSARERHFTGVAAVTRVLASRCAPSAFLSVASRGQPMP